jgi:poly(3-hydroxybutyrate) depolymerase
VTSHPPGLRARLAALLSIPLTATALAVAPGGTAHAAELPDDRLTVTVAGSPAYRLEGDLSSGAIAVTDTVADYRTDRIQGEGTLPGSSGGTAQVSFRVKRSVLGLSGTFTLRDGGVEVSAKVGEVKVPSDGTVTWEGSGTVVRDGRSSRATVAFTLQDRRPDPGDHAIRITHAGQERRAVLRLPDDYDGGPRPVLFHFPGLYEAPWMAELFGRMADYAQSRGFIMITPEHYGPGWQGVLAGTPSPDLDDPGFVERLQDILVERFNADPRRLYASGMSNGGFFTSKMACDNERFAAYAPVAGQLNDQASCRPGRNIPIVLIHGDGDFIVPYTTAPPAADFWARNNGCGAIPASVDLPDLDPKDNTTVVRHTYPDCPGDGPVVLYQIKGGGHNWPGGTPFLGPLLGGGTYDIDANEVIWDFVSRHRLP